jgi:putative membrane protein
MVTAAQRPNMEIIMKKCIALSTAALAATFTFAPLAGAQQADNKRAQQRQEQREQQAGRADEEQQRTPDQHFIKEAAADNQFEIQTSQYVAQQAQDPQTKQLAERLVQDHQRAQQQLQQIAESLNMKLPDELEQWQQAKLQAMQQKHGQHLEMHFAFGQVGDHMIDILKYQYQAEHAKNPQLKQFAEQTIPILQEHLQMAQQVAAQWVPQARTAGERMRGNSHDNDANKPGGDRSGTGNNQGVNR